jgi:hypothetical protein
MAATTEEAYIGYGVLVGLMWLLYGGVSGLFEYRRAERKARGRLIIEARWSAARVKQN